MPSSETPENPGNPASYPSGGSFAALLDWHLDHGTRPEGQGARWNNKRFAQVVGVGERTVRNWRNGRSPPTDLFAIERALFGDEAHTAWRRDLRDAYDGRKPLPEPTPPASERGPIPRPPTHFLGRDDELADLLAWIKPADGAAILVQGGPGHGKTALTQALGNHPDIVTRFGERRRFVTLDTATTDAALRDAITRALGADPAAGFRAALARLAAQPHLLILDNLETPWESPPERRAVEDTLAELAAVPGLALVASFRGRQSIRGPAWTTCFVEHLAPPHDTELFLRHAHGISGDDPDLAPLVAALGGIPLAIELVAAQAFGLDALAPLRRRWDAIGADLAADPDFPPGRLTSLPHSIELSLRSERLTDPARRLFRLLGRLPAGLCAEDRDALLGADGHDAEDRLRRVGLAVPRDGRLDLLPPIRDYAGRRHPPEAPDETAWTEHFLSLTRERGEAIGTRAGAGAVARLLPEYPNIEAATRAQLSVGRRLQAMSAQRGLYRFAYVASLPCPALQELADECRKSGDISGEASSLQRLSQLLKIRSNHNEALKLSNKACELFKIIGDIEGEADCIWLIGTISFTRSDFDAAQIANERALLLFRACNCLRGQANCIRGLGEIALVRSDHITARNAYEEALFLTKDIGDTVGEASCIKRLGQILLERSDFHGARKHYQNALMLFQEIGDALGEANCIWRLGTISAKESDHDIAIKSFNIALSMFKHVGDKLGEANCIWSIGLSAQEQCGYDDALAAYKQALMLYRALGSIPGEADCMVGLGDIARVQFSYAAARNAYEKAKSLYGRFGNVEGEAIVTRRIEALDDT